MRPRPTWAARGYRRGCQLTAAAGAEAAGAAADVLGLPVTVDDDPIETDFGSWEA